MFSKRLYKIAALSKFSSYIGASSLQFNEKTRLFAVDPTKIGRRNKAFDITLFWAIASFSMVIKFKKKGDVDRFNLTLAYWLAGVLVTIVFSITRLFDDELCNTINGTFIFVRYMHRKSFYCIKNISFQTVFDF